MKPMGLQTSERKPVRDNAPGTTPRVGRPPAVTVQAIVAAAIDIGLETVSFKQIADRLGVAPATLYRHVHNRDELVRLAAFQLTLSRQLPAGAHEHWSALAERYAESLYESFLAQPQLIAELLKGRLGPHAELDILEQFIEAMRAHGFGAAEATALFHALGMLTIGAASGAIGYKASVLNDEPWPRLVRKTLAERDEDELPQARAVIGAISEETMTMSWRAALRALMVGLAAARGERLPASGTAR